MSDAMKNEPEFTYGVDLDAVVPDGKGGVMKRYGRARDRAFRHMGDKAPFRADGALYDVMNPGQVVMPTNVQKIPGRMIPTGTGSVMFTPDRLAFCPTPGVAAFGD
jgi:hypothetical protein